MSELVEFLLARIAEDEAAAMPGYPWPQWTTATLSRQDAVERLDSATLGMACPTCHAAPGQGCVAMTPPTHAPQPASAMHAQRRDLGRAEMRRTYGAAHVWNRARVLAECKAKRAIVEAVCTSGPEVREQVARGRFNVRRTLVPSDEAYGDVILPLLALTYADHPDYRREWES